MKSSVYLSQVFWYSLILWVGIGLLLLSVGVRILISGRYGNLNIVEKLESNGVKDIRFLLVLGGLFTASLGVSVLFYLALSIIQDHTEFVMRLVDGKGESGGGALVTIMLGMLGLVMTVVTVGVFSYSKGVMGRIDKKLEEVKGYTDRVKKDVKKHGKVIKGLEQESKKLELMGFQTLLFYQNEREKELIEIDKAGSSKNSVYTFRMQLGAMYVESPYAVDSVRGDKEGQYEHRLIKYLAEHYEKEVDGNLLEEEKIYINKLEKYYKQFYGKEYDRELQQLFDKIEEKIEFRSSHQRLEGSRPM